MTPPTATAAIRSERTRDELVSRLFSVAIVLASHDAFAKHPMTDPVKIARECKRDLDRLCKGLRPGHQRIIGCLKEKVTELSPACAAALKSTE